MEIELRGFKNKDIAKKIILNINNYIFKIKQTYGANVVDIYKLKKIIIAKEFNKTINEIEGGNNYYSKRYRGEAIARILKLKDESYCIVFSLIYFWGLMEFGPEIAQLYFVHEFGHIINENKIDLNDYKNDPSFNDLNILHYMYNEYSAFLISSLTFKNPISQELKKYLLDNFKIYIDELNDPKKLYYPLREAFHEYNFGMIDYNNLFKRIGEPMNTLIRTISYLFGYLDSFSFLQKKMDENKKILFINKYTFDLINRFRNWFETDRVNIREGLEDFMKFYGNLFIQDLD